MRRHRDKRVVRQSITRGQFWLLIVAVVGMSLSLLAMVAVFVYLFIRFLLSWSALL